MRTWPDLASLDPELVKRYGKRGPRYTSYPTAPQFSEAVDREALAQRMRATSATEPPAPLSIYVHVPYCPNKCLYCGCHSVALQDQDQVACYLQELLREADLWAQRLGPGRPHAQLALGGGSPSTLGAEGLRKLVQTLDRAFPPEAGAERSIEVDPNRIDAELLQSLLDLGFSRLSFGIQDFDPEVLRRVGRQENPDTVSRLMGYLRERSFEQVSFDLMLGLPGQSLESFAQTLERVVSLGPSRLALFPYAHVPWMMPHQKALEAWSLPSAEERLALYALAHRRLGEAGYLPVGMDHFAREGDELVEASREHRLHRNFMGYTTRPGLDQIGLGVSAISDIGAAYAQNTKDMDAYRRALDEGRLAIERGFLLSADDEVRRELIMTLLCNFQVDLEALGQRRGLDWRRYFTEELEALAPLEEDGLVQRPGADGVLRVTRQGLPFARLVCMPFDRYLPQTRARYSTTL